MIGSAPAYPTECGVHGRVRLRSAAAPGRVRLAVDGLRRRPEVERGVAARLGRLPGVHRVEPSALTGNVLLEFEPERWTPHSLLLASGRALGLEPEAPDPGGHADPSAHPVRPAGDRVLVRTSTTGRVRLVVPGLRRSPERERWFEDALRRLPGVRLARASAWTGTLLVVFDPAVCSLQHVLDAARAASAPRLPSPVVATPRTRRALLPRAGHRGAGGSDRSRPAVGGARRRRDTPPGQPAS